MICANRVYQVLSGCSLMFMSGIYSVGLRDINLFCFTLSLRIAILCNYSTFIVYTKYAFI